MFYTQQRNFESVILIELNPVVPLADMKQTTDWTCLQRFNYTKTKMLAVVRECIPRLDLNSCTSTGNFTHTYLECVCTINGCNNFVVTLEDETTISPTTTESTRNTTVEATTTLDSGSGTLGLSSASIKCYLLAFSVGFAFLAF